MRRRKYLLCGRDHAAQLICAKRKQSYEKLKDTFEMTLLMHCFYRSASPRFPHSWFSDGACKCASNQICQISLSHSATLSLHSTQARECGGVREEDLAELI